MHWNDIESIGRESYNLSEVWHLCAVDASDPNVMRIEFSKKGSRGGWLKGSENRFKGYITNYKQYTEMESTPEFHTTGKQMSLF